MKGSNKYIGYFLCKMFLELIFLFRCSMTLYVFFFHYNDPENTGTVTIQGGSKAKERGGGQNKLARLELE